MISLSDGCGGDGLEVQADNVINATGVWADRIVPGELHSEAELPQIVPSRGTHLLLSDERLPLRAGAIVPVADGRSIFALPWLGRSLVGTTDETYEGGIEHVQPSEHDVDYLLGAVNEFFGSSLGRADLAGAYAGVRPLISSGDSRRSVDISRREELFETSSGMITITGGKLTTWRRMAKLAVDRLVARDGRQAPCRTQEIPLGAPADPEHLPRVPGVAEEAYASLAGRYGFAAAAGAGSGGRRSVTGAADRPRPARPAGRGPVRGDRRAGVARSATCCCDARGWDCWPRASAAVTGVRSRDGSRPRSAWRWTGTPRRWPPRPRASLTRHAPRESWSARDRGRRRRLRRRVTGRRRSCGPATARCCSAARAWRR